VHAAGGVVGLGLGHLAHKNVREAMSTYRIFRTAFERRVAQEFLLRYQHAVDTKDVETMNELFWTSPFMVRFGPNGRLTGHNAIASYRPTRTASSEPRTLYYDFRPQLCHDQH
jgi:hypothetical protein